MPASEQTSGSDATSPGRYGTIRCRTLTVAADERAKVSMMMPIVRRPPGGGLAVVAFALAIIVVAVAMAAYRPAIDYGADPRRGTPGVRQRRQSIPHDRWGGFHDG